MASAIHPTKPNKCRLRKRPLISLVAGAVALGALIAGCGGSAHPGSPPGSSAGLAVTRARYVAYAACMRSHGVGGYPDPQVSGSAGSVSVRISPGSANPSSPAFRSADRVCHDLLPNGGAQGSPGGSSAQEQTQDVLFADCMRSHGVPSFPDAGRDGVFTLPATINPQAPAFLHAYHVCPQPSSLSIDQTPPTGS